MIHLVSTVLFAILTVIWSRGSAFSVLLKAAFLLMTCWHGLYVLKSYGYIMRTLP